MQNDGLKNLKTCCLTAFKGLLCIPGSDGVSCTSPVFTQGSYHSCNPLCPAATKTEKAHSHFLTYLAPMLAPGSARMLLNPTMELQPQTYGSHISLRASSY